MSIITAGIPVPASGEGPFADVSAMVGPKTVVFSGRFQGIYELLGSHDDSHFVPILQFDAGGVEGVRQTIAGSFKSMRLRAATPATSPGSGVTCEVSALAGAGQNYFAVVALLPAGAAPGLTPTIDLAALFPPTGPEEDICFLCEGGLAGQLVVLGSLDGVDFCPVGSYRRDRVPEGSPISAEFSVLPSPDKVRYVRLSLDGEAADSVVVTIGGRVPIPANLPETLAQTYAVGSVPADQTMILEDARGGQVVVDASDAGFTGPYALTVLGKAVRLQAGLVLGTGLLPPGESDLVVGPGATSVSVANSGRFGYAVGSQQFMVSMNGGAYVPLLTAPAAGGFTAGSVPFGSVTGSLAEDNANLYWDAAGKRLGIDVASSPTARLHLAGVTTVAGTAPLKINAGTLLSSVEVGAVESDGTNLYWTDSGGIRRQLNNAATSTLALSYAAGSAASDQTLTLLDAKGGGLVVDGSGVSFTGASSLSITGATGGLISFGRTGGVLVNGSMTVTSAGGAAWNAFNLMASILTLSGATTPVTALTLLNVAGPTVSAASAVVVTDFYAARIGTATFIGAGPASATRSWSLYAEGNVRFGGGLTLKSTDVNAAGPYVVLDTDFFLEVRYTTIAAIQITLPALTGGTQLNGRIIPIKDSGYNAAANNITIAVGNGADKIENGAAGASYTINVRGQCLWLKSNTTTNNWEII